MHWQESSSCQERDSLIDNLLLRIHFSIVMIRWTGLAPWEFESPFPGSLTSTLLSSGTSQVKHRTLACECEESCVSERETGREREREGGKRRERERERESGPW